MTRFRYLLLLFCLNLSVTAFAQRDIDFHLNGTFLQGKQVLKVKRDAVDPYLWVLAANNEVYRINSITKDVVNYTNVFAGYSEFRFIDIAGRSADTVLIATNTANILDYKKGTIKVIGAAAGLSGAVNSVGIDYARSRFPSSDLLFPSMRMAFIGTAAGLYRYDYAKEIIYPPTTTSTGAGRVFEMNYRNEEVHGLNFCRCYADTVEKYDVSSYNAYTLFGGEIWLGGNSFGHDLKTVYTIYGNIFQDGSGALFSIFAQNFWATENGLFQVAWNYSYSSQYPHNHYLKGENINKISSIYGLTSFASTYNYGGARENLLVGTDNGLYFSNSQYQHYNAMVPVYDFYHYDGLGTKKINDICINANTYDVPTSYDGIICEDAIWVAANDGLYLLKTDYSLYTNNAQLQSGVQFDGQNYDVQELTMCSITPVKAVVSNFYYRGNTIQWYKDGTELPNESAKTLSITAAGQYYAVLYDPCTGNHMETNHLKVTKLDGPVFTFNYPDRLYYCYGSNATLQTEANTNYQYRWYKDGVLNGNTTNQLNITQNGKYKLEVSACSGSWTPTKEVEVNFIKVPQPVVMPDKTAYCAGETAVLSVSVPTDATGVINWQPYQYRWYKNGLLINGAVSSTLNVTQTGKYKVEVTACSDNSATSAEVQPDFISLPAINIYPDKQGYCTGSQATLSIKPPSGNISYTVDWTRNGITLPAEHNKTSIITGMAGSYKASIGSALTSCNQISDEYILSFETPPTLVITRTDNVPLCSGQTIGLKATSSGGTISWSNGQTAPQINVSTSGNYMATVKTTAGCEVTQSYNVQFLSNPSLNVPNATLCQFTNEQITLTAPAGFAKYEWNGQQGSSTYNTNLLGDVRLKVTDVNGCFATQTISINSHCDNIHIPNAFTPNGDGNNDRWVIGGLEGDATVNVKIYNRLGKAIFESQGYIVPWDGTFKGSKLPAGVYYYVISAKKSSQVLSGYVTLIY